VMERRWRWRAGGCGGVELAGGYHQRAVLVGAGVGESGCVSLLLLLLLLLPMSTMRLRTLQANHAEMEHPHDTR
jgi:hypothetical protein